MSFAFLQTPAIATHVARTLARGFAPDGLVVRIGALGWFSVTSLDVRDLSITDIDGTNVFEADHLEIDQRLWSFLKGTPSIRRINVHGARLTFQDRPDGSWGLGWPTTSTDSAPTSADPLIRIDRISVTESRLEVVTAGHTQPTVWTDTTVVLDSLGGSLSDVTLFPGGSTTGGVDAARTRLRTGLAPQDYGLVLEGTGLLDGTRFTLDSVLAVGSATRASGSLGVDWTELTTGGVARMSGEIATPALAPEDIRAFAPAWRGETPIAVSVTTDSPVDTLSLSLDASAPGYGSAVGDVRLAPSYVAWSLDFVGLDPRVVAGPDGAEGSLNGSTSARMSGARPVEWDGPISVSLTESRFGAAHVQPSQLHLSLDGGHGVGELVFIASDSAGRTEVNGEVRTRPFDPVPEYSLRGSLIHRFTTTNEPRTFHGIVAVDGQGVTPGTLALDASLEADMRKRASQMGSLDLQSFGATLQLEAQRGTWGLDSRVASGNLQGGGAVSLSGQRVRVSLDQLSWDSLNVAALAGDTVPSHTSGRARGVVEWQRGAPGVVTAAGFLTAGESRYGAAGVDSTLWTWGLDESGYLVADAEAWADSGSVTARLVGTPLDPYARFEVTDGVLMEVDLAAFGVPSPDTMASTALNGSFSGLWTGTTPPSATARLEWRLRDSRINRADSVRSSGRITLADGRAVIEGSVESPSAGDASIRVSSQPFATVPSWEAERIAVNAFDASVWTGIPASRGVTLNGEAVARGAGLDPKTASASGQLDLDGTTVFGAAFDRARLEFEMGNAVLEASLSGATDSTRLAGSAAFQFLAQPRYEADLSAWMTPGDSVRTLVVRVEGEGLDPTTSDTRIHMSVDSALFWGTAIDRASVRAALNGGRLSIDTLHVAGPSLLVVGAGGVALAEGQASDLTVRAEIEALDLLRPIVDARPLSIGEGTVELEVSGPYSEGQIVASASTNALLWGELQLVGLDSELSGELVGLSPSGGTFNSTFTSLQTPTASVERTEATAQFDGDVVVVDVTSVVDARRSLELVARVDPHPERRIVELDRLSASLDADEWTLVHPASLRYGEIFQIDSFDLRANDQRFFVNGRLAPAGDQEFEVTIDGFGIGTVSDLIGWTGLEGELSGSGRIAGTAGDPQVDLTWEARLSSPQTVPVELAGGVEYANSTLALDARITGADGELTAVGTVPVTLRTPWAPSAEPLVGAAEGPVDVLLESDSLRFGWLRPLLDPMGLRAVSGRLSADMRVLGTAADPLFKGESRLWDGSLELESLGTRWDGLQALAILDGSTLTLDSLVVESGDGLLTADGTIEFERLDIGTFDVSVRADEFEAVDNTIARAVVSGEGEIGGTTHQPQLRGDVRLLSTDVFLGGLPVGNQVADVELSDTDYQELQAVFGRDYRQRTPQRLTLVDSLDVSMSVSMGRDTWIRQAANPRMAVQLSGDVQLSKPRGDSISVLGTVDAIPERSYLEQFGRRFTLRSGTVDFRGHPGETEVDIIGTYSVPSVRNPDQAEVTIELGVSGTPEEIQLVLSSEPSMDNSDIVSYLATGRPASQDLALTAGSGQGGLSELGAGLAVDAVTNAIEGAAAEQVGLDVIDIEVDGLDGARLVAGRYVSPRLFVGFRQPLSRSTETDRSRGGQYGTEVEVEYQALRWLLLNLQAGGRGFDFLLRSRVAY